MSGAAVIEIGPLPVIEGNGVALICLMPGDMGLDKPVTGQVSRRGRELLIRVGGSLLVVPDGAERGLRSARSVRLSVTDWAAPVSVPIRLLWDI